MDCALTKKIAPVTEATEVSNVKSTAAVMVTATVPTQQTNVFAILDIR